MRFIEYPVAPVIMPNMDDKPCNCKGAFICACHTEAITCTGTVVG